MESQWRYIDTVANPADEGTKTTHAKTMWIDGPSFLKEDEDNWPANYIGKAIYDPELGKEELRPVHTMKHVDRPKLDMINVEWCSDWTRLKRAVCIAMKYTDWLKSKAFNSNFSKEITATDMENAETILITKAQWETFPDEMTELSLKQTVDKSSSIRKLTPFLDQDGTMKSEKRTIWS